MYCVRLKRLPEILCTAIFGTAARTEAELSGDDLAALEMIAVGLSSSKREHYGRAPRAGVVPALFSLCQHPASDRLSHYGGCRQWQPIPISLYATLSFAIL